MKKYTIEEIKNITGEEIIKAGSQNGMSIEEFKNLTDQAVKYASKRRERALKAIEDRNLPLPIAFKEWGIKTHEKIDKKIDMSKISKDYGIGYATISFKPPKDATLNELKHAFRLSRDFLRTKTSTIGGDTYIDPTTGKKAIYLDERGEIIPRRNKKGEVIYKNGKIQPIYKLTGWAGAVRDVEVRLSLKSGFHFSRDEYTEFWKLYQNIYGNKTVQAYGTSEQVQELIYNSMSKFKSKSELLSSIIEKLKSNYEEDNDEDLLEEFESGGSYFNGGSNR